MLDSFPSKYFSYIFRNHRWVRGDIQIWKWLFSKRLNRISKFKILDNIRRTLVKPVSFILLLFILFSSSICLKCIAPSPYASAFITGAISTFPFVYCFLLILFY